VHAQGSEEDMSDD
jgi:hypothetical protein